MRASTSYKRIGSVAGGRGALRFSPAQGARGLRQIVALVESAGVPTPDHVVARYRLAPALRLARPMALALRRTGSGVVASWSRVPGAAAYALVARTSNGALRVVRVPRGRTAFRLRGVPPTLSGLLSVRAVGDTGSLGPATRVRFAATKRTPSPFRPNADLGRRKGR